MATKDIKKDVKYLNRDFKSFRNNLIDYAKTYFPNSYNDFNESSPGMMFMEMASYVGDVLSYYTDKQFKESLLLHTEERKNIIDMAQAFGYIPKASTSAVTKLDIYQTIPTEIDDDGEIVPDYTSYGLNIKSGLSVKSEGGVYFRTMEDCDFSNSGSVDETTVYQVDENESPTRYLLRKRINIESGDVKTQTSTFGAPKKFNTITLSDTNVLGVKSVTDSDGNVWREVDYLAQDVVYDEDNYEVGGGSNYTVTTTEFVMKRFIRRLNSQNKTILQFGAGESLGIDEGLLPDPSNTDNTDIAVNFDPNNFLNSNTYGEVPMNTTLTVEYYYGGGVESNVPADMITTVSVGTGDIYNDTSGGEIYTTELSSVAVNNPFPATGGKGAETIDEIRQNALSAYAAQNRCVTKKDYMNRVYMMPGKYGNAAKAYVASERLGEIDVGGDLPPSPVIVYVLGYDNNKKLTYLQNDVKTNIATYLEEYKMIDDGLLIIDGAICNVGVAFSVYTYKNFNKHEVLLKCSERIKDYFKIEKMKFQQPIMLGDLEYELSLVDGVRSVEYVYIFNRHSQHGNYSEWTYGELGQPAETADLPTEITNFIMSSTDGLVLPSVTPVVFELKFPETDIVGRAR